MTPASFEAESLENEESSRVRTGAKASPVSSLYL